MFSTPKTQSLHGCHDCATHGLTSMVVIFCNRFAFARFKFQELCERPKKVDQLIYSNMLFLAYPNLFLACEHHQTCLNTQGCGKPMVCQAPNTLGVDQEPKTGVGDANLQAN
jgi:hypothetical protein